LFHEALGVKKPNRLVGITDSSVPREVSMPYDRQLRVIGQALETKRINVFELKNTGERYVVHGTPEKDPSFRAKLRDWGERIRGQSLVSPLNYALSDLERLDQQEKLQRAKSNRLPDFYRLSNTLRTVGFYLDQKRAELLEIHKRPLSMILLYQNHGGHPDLEERSIASFYNLFIELHGKRRGRE
jgi:hypothetical protein